jgi:hypothetical protein
MKKIILTCLGLASAGYIYSQNAQTRTLDSFNRIRIAGSAKVFLTPAATQKVTVEAKEEQAEVVTTVENRTLFIDGDPSSIYIEVPEIASIDIGGTGKVQADSGFHGESLELGLSGNGKISMPAEYHNIYVGVSGYGRVELEGTADKLRINISGNGSVDAENLKTSAATVNISGKGKALLDVSDSLDMNISGIGTVLYKTEPRSVTRKVSGIGRYGIADSDDEDTTTVHIGKKRIIIVGGDEQESRRDEDHDVDKKDDFDFDFDFDKEKEKLKHKKDDKKARSHWAGIDLGFNGYFHDKLSPDLPKGYDFLELNTGKSVSVGINIWHFDFPIYKRYVMLATGIGMTLNNYRFSSDRTLIEDSSRVAAAFDFKETGEQINYNKNKLAVNYVTVPLLLQFNTHHRLKKSFHIGAGLLFSYKYDSHLKLVYDDKGDKQKIKRRDDFNTQPFRYDFTMRIGYRNYTLFANYAMTELFKDNTGPSLHPFTVGVQLVGW